MSNISKFMQLGMLDWALLTGGTIRRPLSVTCGLTTDIPTNTSGTEIINDAGYSRGVPAFGPTALVNNLGGSASNGYMTFGPFISPHTINGVIIFDDLSNQLFFAQIGPPALSVKAGDMITMFPGALEATLG